MLSRIKDPNVLLRIGLVALVLGSASGYLLRHSDAIPDFVAGFLAGLFHGIAIGTLCLSIARRRWMAGGGPCAR